MVPHGTGAAKSGEVVGRSLEAIQSTSVQAFFERGYIVYDLYVYGRGDVVCSEVGIAQDLIRQGCVGYHVFWTKTRGGFVGRDVTGSIGGGADW